MKMQKKKKIQTKREKSFWTSQQASLREQTSEHENEHTFKTAFQISHCRERLTCYQTALDRLREWQLEWKVSIITSPWWWVMIELQREGRSAHSGSSCCCLAQWYPHRPSVALRGHVFSQKWKVANTLFPVRENNDSRERDPQSNRGDSENLQGEAGSIILGIKRGSFLLRNPISSHFCYSSVIRHV